MAETNGFYFPDRCANCAFIHWSLEVFDEQVDDLLFGESSRSLVAQRHKNAETIAASLRLKRQRLFDTAEFECDGTLPNEPGELAPCRLTESLNRPPCESND